MGWRQGPYASKWETFWMMAPDNFQARWVKAHLELPEALERGQTYAEWHGNCCADGGADKAAERTRTGIQTRLDREGWK